MWTRKAIVLTGAASALLAAGIAARSAGALGAGLTLLAFVVVNRLLFRGSAEISSAREVDLKRVYESESTHVQLRLENPGNRLLFLEVRDRLPRQLKVESGAAYDFVALPAGAVDELKYEVRAPLLGVYEVGPTDLRLEDPFGLFYEERATEGSDTLWVLPRREDLRKAQLESRLPMPLMGDHQVNRPGDGFDFFALREYVPGDTLRSVNWKASARTGKMMVNQMMRTTAAEVTIFVDGRAITAAGREDESARVMIARTVASFTEFVFVRKDQPRLYIYSDHVREIEPQPPERMIPYTLETLAELQPKGNFPVRLAMSQALPSLKPMTPCIFITSALDDDTLVEAVSTLLANNMQVAVVSPRPHSLPGVEGELARALLAERETVLREVGGLGAVVIELDPGASLAATMEKGRLLVA
ncbi:MAG TPA: DUF58 domain-containing protein [Candidatus Thermoplasmatota archaeon]|nr:DUF58 domain-containing protein [Candidatus Thermoplasmatota archaeon]